MLPRPSSGSLLGEAINPRSLLPLQVRLQHLSRIGQHRLKRKTARPTKAERRQVVLELQRRQATRREHNEREWLRNSRDEFRADMLRQYVLERRHGGWRHESTEGERLSHWKRKPRRYDEDVQCGIFWDIENVSVRHE